MVSQYPAKIDNLISLPTAEDGVTPVSQSAVNNLNTAIIKIQTTLGVSPAGTAGSVKDRLNTIENSISAIDSSIVTINGDIGGSASSPLVIALQGNPISSEAPDLADVLTWNGIAWVPAPSAGGGGGDFIAGGDLSGLPTSQVVVGIQGTPVSNVAPSEGQALVCNGGQWEPGNSVSFTAGGDLGGNETSQSVKGLTGIGGSIISIAHKFSILDDANDVFWTDKDSVDTANTTPVNAYTWTLPSNTLTNATVTVRGINGDASKAVVFVLRRQFRNMAGTVTAFTLDTIYSDNAEAAAISATLTNTTTTGKVVITGDASWRFGISIQVEETAATGTTPPPSFVYADIAWTLDFEGDNRTNHALVGTASAGTSGSHQMVSPSSDTISAGGTFNSHASIDWQSDTIWSFGEFVLSDVISSTAFTIIYALDILSISAVGTEYYNAPRLIGDGLGSYFGTAISDIGSGNQFIAGVYDGAFKRAAVAVSTGKQILTFRLNGGTMSVRKNKEAWVDVTGLSAVSLLTGHVRNNDPSSADVDIARVSFTNTALSNGDVDSAIDFLAARYGITV